ncbi:ERMES complex subunit [Coniosporium apollinis]|uniref:Mitochondrial distribution and morphology protein 34 n=1 Tax=Coniosporium apollinis TaxID=61459 RepID=A0ABQ9NY80_9PEZI|nr:ERMES complex subunit [Coniosporium apollinis]
MAFNFNWSPLIADTSRARDMLTTALNKSPKPPIIVDDILVTELNLGSVPPELEILEIGDLAEDRFRGIFKMSYTGDAFLTLKTRVQANPLNTYLSTKPSFASPQPLAASSGLTIPLQITLSDIRLSGFVILVFSRQKGLTLVFRNDPLESLKVSSTFDSIPFVRDYLQKEIEGQLRVLFMEDLPAILHQLSLRLWSPDYRELDNSNGLQEGNKDGTIPIDPLSSPPQNPVDGFGNPITDSETSPFFLDDSTQTHASFSQKNLLRLGALAQSHRTLSLFTPGIREAVFRAWAGTTESKEHSGAATPALTLSSLSRAHSSMGLSTLSSAYSASDGVESGPSSSSRPTLSSFNSAIGHGLTLGANRSRAHAQRKRKRRVVNLRKDKNDDNASDTASITTGASTPAPSVIVSEPLPEREEDLVTPPRSPAKNVRFSARRQSGEYAADSPARSPRARPSTAEYPAQENIKLSLPPQKHLSPDAKPVHESTTSSAARSRPPLRLHHPTPSTSAIPLLRTLSAEKLPFTTTAQPVDPFSPSSSSGGILEQAWMMKMANEIARKVQDEKRRQSQASNESAGFWEMPPPAYSSV